jgi:isocitrate dehydrogenase
MQTATHGDLELTMVSNRGVSVWPEFMEETFTADYFRCRFTTKDSKNGMVNHGQILKLMEQVNAAGFDIVKIETLRNFDGKPGYSLAQGQ